MRDTDLMSRFLIYLASARIYYSDITRNIRDEAFAKQILAIGRDMGWKVLQHGLIAIFGKMTSSNINLYCTFLYELASPLNATADQALICKHLLKMVINTLSAEQDVEPLSLKLAKMLRGSWV